MKDYYKILNISTEASKDEIKKAFRSLAKKYHPDRNKNDTDALRKFQEVNEAYEVLNNEDSRRKYEQEFFKAKNTREANSTDNRSNNSSNKKYQDKGESIENLNKYFESFFGFNANSNNINKDKLQNKKNPMDTSKMFESFFNIKKK
ncbi:MULTISPECIES: DnaJ domain-containing protein [unclassified Clostridium]|uniref:DnaJ domain-containing protein n=1 Tax=unclassified Clostridium TaxID=2614128 RepID=UPI0002977790|nr:MULTISPECIES: DnaJ domain-containing protein [unclassified Clostridium]EKQ51002.1 MAG: DnaJ-class molecular chaperone [Clostridium sp. Maddingley MBC34-26]